MGLGVRAFEPTQGRSPKNSTERPAGDPYIISDALNPRSSFMLGHNPGSMSWSFSNQCCQSSFAVRNVLNCQCRRYTMSLLGW